MSRIITICLAVCLDLSWGDPPNQFHPVALMGNWLSRGRRLAPGHARFWFGAGWIVAGVALFALPWGWLERRRRAKIGAPILLKVVFAYRNLRRNVAAVGLALAVHNLPEARRLAGWHLVSRETGRLSSEEIAGAAIESLAENLTDSLTAPLLAYAVGGLPAAWAYRFVNTADAMWGYRNSEFEELGKFPARLDDLLNWLPARLTGWLIVGATWLAGGQARRAARVMLDQHGQTPSPNAGWTMSAMAGALGVSLSKRGVYVLTGGEGRPDAAAIQRALRLADLSALLSVVCAILAALAVRRRRWICRRIGIVV